MKTVRFLIAVGLALGVTGCSLTGSWRTVQVEPPGGSFPVKTLSLDRDLNYTATWADDDTTRTSIGRYRWNGFTLTLTDAGFEPDAYSAREQGGGDLVLSHAAKTGRVTATMTRVEP